MDVLKGKPADVVQGSERKARELAPSDVEGVPLVSVVVQPFRVGAAEVVEPPIRYTEQGNTCPSDVIGSEKPHDSVSGIPEIRNDTKEGAGGSHDSTPLRAEDREAF